MDDLELLKAYADHQDQDAFSQLVRRHGGWVYSAARRQLGDGHLAEDVAQAVFLLLVRRARALRHHTYLSGWLFRALGYCVQRAVRDRARLEKREREAATMRPETMQSEANWDEIAPVLEQAVARLSGRDRDAVLLRFYEQRPLAEVGSLLGISEDAARMRVQRAVEKLRGMLEKQGVTGTSAGLSAVLVGNVVQQVPSTLVDGAMRAVNGGNAAAGGIAKGVMNMMALAKVKIVAAMTVLIVGGLVLAASTTRPPTTPATATTSRSPAGDLPSASTIIERYRKNQSAFDRCVIRSRSHMTFVNTGSGATLMETQEAIEYRVDGGRLDVNLATDFVHLGREAPPPSQTMRRIWDGSTWSVVARLNGPTPLVDAQLLRDEKQKSDFMAGGPEATLFGFLPADLQTWDTILQDATSMDVESQDGLYLLEASTPHGRYQVWLDPQNGYAIKKVQVHKGENDIAYGRPLRDHKINKNAGLKSSFDTPEGRRGIDISLAVSRMERIGNAWAPMGAHWTVKTTYADGTVLIDTEDRVREHVDFAPDFAAMPGAFAPDIPEGSRVSVAGAPNVRYVWRNGKPVPDVDGRANSNQSKR